MNKKLYIVFAVIACIFGTTIRAQECYVPGELNGIYHYSQNATSYNACLDLCKADTECKYFTFNGGTNVCIEYILYTSIDSATCSICFSGERNCSAIQECNIQGLCQGTYITTLTELSLPQCQETCKNENRCRYFAYNGPYEECTLLESCIDRFNCTGCVSGQKDCPIIGQGKLAIKFGETYKK